MAGSLAKQMMDPVGPKKNRRGQQGPTMQEYRQLYMNDEQYLSEFHAAYPRTAAAASRTTPRQPEAPPAAFDSFSHMDGYSDYDPTSQKRYETAADPPENEYEYFREEQDYAVPTEYSDSDMELNSGGPGKSPSLLPRGQGMHSMQPVKTRSGGKCLSRRCIKIFFSLQAMTVLLLAAGVAYCYFTDTNAQDLGSFLTRSKQDSLLDSTSTDDGNELSDQTSSVDPYATQGSSYDQSYSPSRCGKGKGSSRSPGSKGKSSSSSKGKGSSKSSKSSGSKGKSSSSSSKGKGSTSSSSKGKGSKSSSSKGKGSSKSSHGKGICEEQSPTEIPTVSPSAAPSASKQPSAKPSAYLDLLPPTTSPSHAPSASKQPSSRPSEILDLILPTASPSHAPSVSKQPSKAPSSMPSTTPSQAPSVSKRPSKAPSSMPSATPSHAPSASKQPSKAPSNMPSASPTSAPSVSAQPSTCLVENIAFGKHAAQSSTDFDGDASRAVDGDTNPVYTSNSITHTEESDNPWWYVDFGGAYRIEQVVIWNRLDCCSDRLSGARVRLMTTISTDGSNDVASEVVLPDMTGQPNYEWDTTEIANTDILGVLVFLPFPNTYLSLAEVEVFGARTNCPIFPSSSPSSFPTALPSAAPSKSAKPSASPSTLRPSASPSMAPSKSASPSQRPTTKCPLENAALGKPTKQKSTGFNGDSSRAVDGNTSGIYTAGSVTHTTLIHGPWWYVDLQGSYRIQKVVIWNRTDCCSDRLSNARVRLLTSIDDDGTNYVSELDLGNMDGEEKVEWDTSDIPNSGIVGVYVFIPANGVYLALAEVEVTAVPETC